MIFGLCGYAGVGKDTAARVLVEEFGYKRVAFADPMREALEALDPLIPCPKAPPRRLLRLVDELGWEVVKGDPEVRRLMQQLGTEVGRNIIGQDIWVNLAAREMDDRTVVTDVRFPNEARLIRGRGGVLVRLDRPGFGPVNEHISDRASANWTYEHHITNDGDVGLLHHKMRELARAYEKGESP